MTHWTNLRQISFSLILLSELIGCGLIGSFKPIEQRHTQSVEIAEATYLELMPPSALGVSLALTQSVTTKHVNAEYKMLAQIEIDRNSLIFVGMTPFGQHLFSIEYKNNRYHYDVAPILQDRIKPEYLLADFQLSYWPTKLLQTRLSGGVIQVVANRRSIYRDDDTKVVDISYEYPGLWSGTVAFKHLERDYSVFVKTLAVEELTEFENGK